MARLTSIRSRLTTVRPKIASTPVDRASFDRARDQRSWRKWYKTSRWRALRWAVLVRDCFTCQMCGRLESDTSQLVADHRTPHRGDANLFWDEGNLWTLCASCHSGAKQREERADG